MLGGIPAALRGSLSRRAGTARSVETPPGRGVPGPRAMDATGRSHGAKRLAAKGQGPSHARALRRRAEAVATRLCRAFDARPAHDPAHAMVPVPIPVAAPVPGPHGPENGRFVAGGPRHLSVAQPCRLSQFGQIFETQEAASLYSLAMKFGFIAAAALFLASCSTATMTEVAGRRAAPVETLPNMKTFSTKGLSAPRGQRVKRSNADIARDFLDLTFQMESGRRIDRMSRFEGPIRIALVNGRSPGAVNDLDALIRRLRSEAGIDIARTARAADANIIVEMVPARQMRRLVPQAACFVVPRVSGWNEFKRFRRSSRIDWTNLDVRRRAAVFIPLGVAPQEVRDCLHEEIAQALGPLNDLYRLPDSVFNDDNFHSVLTPFDMLILRAYYAPELRSGMTRAEVARVLPSLLDRINPAGRGLPAHGVTAANRAWIDAIERAMSRGTSRNARIEAARKAVALARGAGWQDNRLAFSLFAYGRVALATEPDAAIAAFAEANKIFRGRYGAGIQAAHVDLQLAGLALSSGQADTAIRLADRCVPAVMAEQNAALLATLLMIKAEALELKGRSTEARAVRLDSLGWARYGFGSEELVRQRLQEISALAPQLGRPGTL